MIKSWLLIFFLCATTTLFSQTPRLEQLKEIVAQKATLSDSTVLLAINDLFEEYYYRRDTLAMTHYNKILFQEAKSANNVFYERQANINQAYIYLQNNVGKGKAIVDSLLIIITKDQQTTLLSQCYTYLGKTIINENAKDTSFLYFQKALDVLNEGNKKERATALIDLAHVTSNKFGYKSAIDLLKQAVDIAKAAKHNILTTKALVRLGKYQYIISEYKKASSTLVEAVELGEYQQYISADMIDAYLLLGDLYWSKNKDIENARFYTKQAYELSKVYNNNLIKSKTAAFHAYYYIVGNNPNLDLAKEFVLYSLQIGIDHEMLRRQANAHFYLGMIYSKKDSFSIAYPHYIQGIQLSKKANLNSYSLRIQAYLTEELIKEDQDIPDFIDTATINPSRRLDNKIWFYAIKKDIAFKNKDYQQAFSFSEKLYKLRMHSQEERCKIDVEEQLLACKLEDEQEKSTMQAALLQATTFQNRLLLGASILATLLLGVFYFLYQIKRQHNKVIIEKNEKISASLEQISSLNKSLNAKNELLAEKNSIQQNELVEYITLQSNQEQQLKTIQKEIKQNINNNANDITHWQLTHAHIEKLISSKNEWVHFKQKIESLYPSFFMNLLLKHSNLTDRDQIHCVYILLGMNVNQVAKTLFVTPKSAESARYRIKKKLGLEATDNLTDYVKNFSSSENK